MKLQELFSPTFYRMVLAHKRFAVQVGILEKKEGLKINLGALDKRFPGFFNLDIVAGNNIDIVADLTQDFPFLDDTLAYIRAYDVFEHLPEIIHTMNECWRVLDPGGILEVAVPHTEGLGAFQDPTHRSFWNRGTLEYFISGTGAFTRMKYPYGIKSEFQLLEKYQDKTSLYFLMMAVK